MLDEGKVNWKWKKGVVMRNEEYNFKTCLDPSRGKRGEVARRNREYDGS